jgi:hypothetical protein
LAIRADQGEEAYLAAHDAFMGGDARDTQRPMLYVEEAGFDSEIIQQLTQSAEVQAEISQTREIAQALGSSGTPGFITRTNILRGYADSATLSEAVFRFEEQESGVSPRLPPLALFMRGSSPRHRGSACLLVWQDPNHDSSGYEQVRTTLVQSP